MNDKNISFSNEELEILKESLFKLKIKYTESSLYRYTQYLPLLSKDLKDKIASIEALKNKLEN